MLPEAGMVIRVSLGAATDSNVAATAISSSVLVNSFTLISLALDPIGSTLNFS